MKRCSTCRHISFAFHEECAKCSGFPDYSRWEPDGFYESLKLGLEQAINGETREITIEVDE